MFGDQTSTLQADDGCVIRTYIQTPYGINQTLALWNATFVDYLNEQLGESLGCSFELKPLVSVDNAYDVVKRNLTEFLFISPGQMHCIEVCQACCAGYIMSEHTRQASSAVLKQIITGISPVASLVNWVKGRETSVYGGCVFVRSDRTDITSLKHLTNASVSNITQVTCAVCLVCSCCLTINRLVILQAILHCKGFDFSTVALCVPAFMSSICS